MYENRNMYITQHASDPYFFAKVLYAIDHALQKHWRSCSISEDRLSVNENVLRMHEVQDSILSLAFSQQIPKLISDKIDDYLEKNSDKEDKGKNGKRNRGGNGNNHDSNQKNQEVLYNSDKSNPHGASRKGKTFRRYSMPSRRNAPRPLMAN
jgi:hypothetical protein